MVAYYRVCARCRCSMDCSEGVSYPGEGRVCEECAQELDLEAAYRKSWAFTKEQLEERKRELTGFRVRAEGIA